MSLNAAYTALNRMREATDLNLPFSFSFISCSESKATSKGLAVVNKALLRTGYSNDKGVKSQSLIAYYDLDKEKNGFFYLPLLMTYKGKRLCQ